MFPEILQIEFEHRQREIARDRKRRQPWRKG